MKWRDLALTIAALLILAPFIQAQTMPAGGLLGGTAGFVRAADGTCGTAPSMSFAADSDTGWYRSGSGAIEFCSNASRGPQFVNSTFGTTGGGLLSEVLIGPTNSGGISIKSLAIASMTLANGTDSSSPTSLSLAGSRALAVPAGALGLATSATSSVGQTGQGVRFIAVCGPTAGTASLLFYAGTSNTPVVLANAVGGGLIGC